MHGTVIAPLFIDMRKIILLILLMLIFAVSALGTTRRPVHRVAKQRHHHKALHEAGWAGAGIAAGRAVGPIGGAAVGTTKYRRDLKAGGRRRTGAIAKIGVPVAVGIAAGPVGSVGYAAVEHRRWIKRHLLHRKAH